MAPVLAVSAVQNEVRSLKYEASSDTTFDLRPSSLVGPSPFALCPSRSVDDVSDQWGGDSGQRVQARRNCWNPKPMACRPPRRSVPARKRRRPRSRGAAACSVTNASWTPGLRNWLRRAVVSSQWSVLSGPGPPSPRRGPFFVVEWPVVGGPHSSFVFEVARARQAAEAEVARLGADLARQRPSAE